MMGKATRSQYPFSSQLDVLSGSQAFLGLRTSSVLCMGCSLTLKISGESDSRGTCSRGAGSLYSSSGLRRAALMVFACSLKGNTENPLMLIWLLFHPTIFSGFLLLGAGSLTQYFPLQIFPCQLTWLQKYLN